MQLHKFRNSGHLLFKLKKTVDFRNLQIFGSTDFRSCIILLRLMLKIFYILPNLIDIKSQTKKYFFLFYFISNKEPFLCIL